jgi:hypothetical protein
MEKHARLRAATVRKRGRDGKEEARAERCPVRKSEAIERFANEVKEFGEIRDREELESHELEDVEEARIRSQMSSKSESSLVRFRSECRATSANAEKLNDDKSEDEISKKCEAANEISLSRSSLKHSSEFIRSTTFEDETSPPDETIRNL